jgi:His/Glu/Gln/Arg/opine family amino acid ABC transporter permease subunit
MDLAPSRRSATSKSPYLSLLPSLAAVLVVVAMGYVVVRYSGFSYAFLFDSTNWDIGFSFLPFVSSDPYWWAFVVGLVNTLIAAAVAIVLATLLGFLLSIVRSSSNPVLAGLPRFYADVIRNIPVILQAMFWYAVYLGMPRPRDAIAIAGARISNRGIYLPWFSNPLVVFGCSVALVIILVAIASLWARLRRDRPFITAGAIIMTALALGATAALIALAPKLRAAAGFTWPEIMGLNIRGGLRVSLEYAALVTAVVFYRAAYISEVFRAGFRSISPGHLDAAHALSLSPWTTLTRIRIPLALITILPPLASEFIVIVKITSIGLLVGFNDLYAISVNATTVTGKTLEIMVLMTLLFLLVNFTIATVMNQINRRVAFKGSRLG